MENIDYQKLLHAENILSSEEQRDLIKRYRSVPLVERPEILLQLLGSNWRLVYKIARRYAKSLEINTAMSVGFIGLIRAIEKIDLDRQTALSTVAFNWIRMELNRAANSAIYNVLVPEYVFAIINKRLKDIDSNSGDISDSHSPADIFTNMYTFDQLSMYYAYNQKKINLFCDNEPDDGSDNFSTSYEPVTNSDAIDCVNMFMDVQTAVATIDNDRSREIMIAYYNLDRGGCVTLEYLGKQYGLTKERIRQLIDKCKNDLAYKLADYS